MGGHRSRRQGIRARHRSLRHLQQGVPGLPKRISGGPPSRVGARLRPSAHREPQELLDDLQSRLDRSGVTVVSEHLDRWADSVPGRVARDQELPGLEKVRQGLRRQTIIWRQLLAGEKEAEAYLDREQRAQLRHELRALALRSYPRFVPALVVGVRALAFCDPLRRDRLVVSRERRRDRRRDPSLQPRGGARHHPGVGRPDPDSTSRRRDPDARRGLSRAELVATVRVAVKSPAIGEPAAGHPA
jgi:hypothetical protein